MQLRRWLRALAFEERRDELVEGRMRKDIAAHTTMDMRIARHALQVMLVMSAMRDEDKKLLRYCPYKRALLLP